MVWMIRFRHDRGTIYRLHHHGVVKTGPFVPPDDLRYGISFLTADKSNQTFPSAAIISSTSLHNDRFRWSRVLRRRSAAACLLGLQVPIPPVYGCPSRVSVMWCQVEISVSGWSLIQRCPTECCGSECDDEASTMRRPWPFGDCCSMSGSRHNDY